MMTSKVNSLGHLKIKTNFANKNRRLVFLVLFHSYSTSQLYRRSTDVHWFEEPNVTGRNDVMLTDVRYTPIYVEKSSESNTLNVNLTYFYVING